MPEWECLDDLHRLVAALRSTEPRPSYRWTELLGRVRLAQAEGAWRDRPGSG